MIEQLEQRLIFAAVPIPVATVAPVKVSESGAHAVVTVKLNRAAAQPVSVSFNAAEVPGSAVANQDFRPAIGVVTIPAGSRSATLSVPIIDDTVYEKNETFRVNLQEPVGLKLKTRFATVTIVDNDPKVGFAPASLYGGVMDGVVSSGSAPFSQTGSFTIRFFENGTYALEGHGDVADSFGVFTYTRTGLNTARMTATDSDVGGTITGNLTFSSPTLAKFTWRLGGGYQSGILMFRTN